jgi:F420-0:gamma-glutamyl ligase
VSRVGATTGLARSNIVNASRSCERTTNMSAGMNIRNGLEESYGSFLGVVIGTTAAAALMCALLGAWLRDMLQ